MIGFSFCSSGASFVTERLGRAKQIFIGDFEIVHAKTEMMEMDTEFELPFLEPED